MSIVQVLILTLLSIIGTVLCDETTTSSSSSTSTRLPEVTTIVENHKVHNEKISRRIIDDRLTPPKSTDFVSWNKRLPSLGEVQRINSPPKVIEDIEENVTEKAVPKKTRTVGPTQDTTCCGGNAKASGSGPHIFPDDKDSKAHQVKQVNSEALELERNAGPAPRFHGNRPSDDRYGWRSSSYLGYGKDKGYYDQRNHYPYDRYSTERRPSLSYNDRDDDRDRYSSATRPNAPFALDGDRYGSGTNSRPGYQNANYAYGGSSSGPGNNYNDRPRPGSGNYGITGTIAGADGDSDYPFAEGPPNGNPTTNLQTQKAVALKALAGVALIGAAAALASNPVLLPISVISGRRKRRSVQLESDNYALTALLQGYIKPKPNEVAKERLGGNEKASNDSNNNNETSTTSQELVISPQCVARLACHVHRDYLDELEKSRAELLASTTATATASGINATNTDTTTTYDNDDDSTFQGLEHWFDSLIHSNILVADYLSDELKSLIKSAVAVGSDKNASCDVFSCLNVHDSNKKTT